MSVPTTTTPPTGTPVHDGLSNRITQVMQWPTTVTPQTIALSFGVAVATGVFFGFYPARKAAGLDPIEALRSA